RWFQVLFHSPHGGSFHRSLTVLSASGRRSSLALERGRPSFPADFSCPRVLTHGTRGPSVRLRGSHPLWRPLPGSFASRSPCSLGGRESALPVPPSNPARPIGRSATQGRRFRLFPGRSPLLGESRVDFCAEG